MTITDWIQAISTVVLVGVTAFYAWRTRDIANATKQQAEATRQQAEASVKMAEEMINARSPYITIRWLGPNPNQKEIPAIVKNEGFGPALNLKFYLTHKEFEFNKKVSPYTTFEVGQKYTLTLPSENFDFKEWKGLAVNCDYQSVSGINFRSTLNCESEQVRYFENIKIKNNK